MTSSSGRRRDPGIDARCLSAARLIYAESGSNAVTFESVSRRAEVGKPALYRRWESAEHLLIKALEELDYDIDVDESGETRTELISFTTGLMDYIASPGGAVLLRLMLELHQRTALYRSVGNFAAEKTLHSVTAIVQRGIERGDVDAGLSPSLVTSVLAGAALYETLARLDAPSLSTQGADYATLLVDAILQRANARPASGGN